ncbi:ribose-phosphate pyrophosphokinase 4 [Biomphalaria glabrata]|nr:ribose-phosphate pyrophosphokinase 4 [Biomphalaria glabrata]
MAETIDAMSLIYRPSHDVVLLYAHPSMHKLARRIAECCQLVTSRSRSSSDSFNLSSSSSSSCNMALDESLMNDILGFNPLAPDDTKPDPRENKIIKFNVDGTSDESDLQDAPSPYTGKASKQKKNFVPVIDDTNDETSDSAKRQSPVLPDITGFQEEVDPGQSDRINEESRIKSKHKNSSNNKGARETLPDSATKPVVQNNSACMYQENKELTRDIQDTRPPRRVEFRDTIKWNKFADGYPNLFIEDVKYMAGKDVIFIGSFHSTEIIFEQLSVLYAFPRYLSRSFHFILPYFPTGTMERVDTEGQIATAKTLATLLSSIPLSAQGPAQIIIYDIHALQERFYFSDNVIPRLETAIPLLQRVLSAHRHKDKLSLAFPDDGAYKRFHSYFPDDERLIVCAKKRVEGNKRIVTIKDGNPNGRHVVIIDDLVQSGGTLIECAKVLIKQGAKSVSAYVTHPVFPNQSWKNFIKCDPPFSNFWITNSIPHAEEICKHRPFTLLSLSDIIADNLLGFDLRPR